jgi:uncharacterized protein YcfL
MKNLLPTLLAVGSLLALAGCADDQNHVVSQSQSASMSVDMKDMTTSSVTATSTDIAPASTQKSSTTTQTDSSQSYPAIHSNGQGAGL